MSEGQTARNDHRYRTPPEAAKRPQKRKQSQRPARAFSGELRPGVSPRSLYWERVNVVTWKLCVRGRFSDTPASHGQWQGYRASFPIAWVMNIGWAVDYLKHGLVAVAISAATGVLVRLRLMT